MYTVNFEWDPNKAATNARKHGGQFADAVAVLEDEGASTIQDEAGVEERWITMGTDALSRILVGVYTLRGRNIRIISARVATRAEARQHMENQ